MATPTLLVDDLRLDSPGVDDATAWSQAQDEECARWFGWPCPPGVDRCRGHLARVAAQAATPEGEREVVWAIRSDAGLAGGIDLKLLGGDWSISYFVHPDHRGRGVATAAVRRVTVWAFAELDAARVVTTVHRDNLASRRVLERTGFRHTGEVTDPDTGHPHLAYALERARPPAEGASASAGQP